MSDQKNLINKPIYTFKEKDFFFNMQKKLCMHHSTWMSLSILNMKNYIILNKYVSWDKNFVLCSFDQKSTFTEYL